MISKLNQFILDWLWIQPNPRFIHFCLLFLPSSPYKQALKKDVLADNPKQALNIIKLLTRTARVCRRIDYLNLRLGTYQHNRAFSQIATGTKGPVTTTTKLLEITKRHGVHPHFGELETLIRQYHLKVGAEIGVFMGYHAAHLLEACRNLKLYGVDLYRVLPGTGYDDWTDPNFDQLYHQVNTKLSASGRFHLLRLTSLEAARQFTKHELDFVYLDADHRLSGVQADLKAWSDKVRSGGIIAGHDYGQQWPGVKQAVTKWVKDHHYQLNLGRGTFWWVIKP